MKLKELFDKYTFDDIVPYLKEIITDNPSSLPDFRMAFDELRMLILFVGILVTLGTNALPNVW